MYRAKSALKLLVAATALISATVVSAGNHNKCYQNYTSCEYFTAAQCAVSAANVGTADAPSWQPCVLNQARAACPTGCATAASDTPSSTQSTYCASVDTTTQQPATAPTYPPCKTKS